MQKFYIPAMALVASTLSMTACGDDASGPYDLTFSGTTFTPHEGQTLEAALVTADGGVVAGPSSTTVTGGAFSFTFPGALTEGTSYTVHYYADHNGSGACDAPPVDHVWSESVPTVIGDTVVRVTHSTAFSNVCSTF